MKEYKAYRGYNPKFLGAKERNVFVNLPILNKNQIIDTAKVEGSKNGVLKYYHHSVILSQSRRLPILSASNIDGSKIKKVKARASWTKDDRAKKFQWGSELYSAKKSDFDKGHMTKREDMQWGKTNDIAKHAAESTFFYANAVPQHKNLNQKIWKKLEDYILHEETIEKRLRISVITGPCLMENDPIFVTKVKGEDVQIPTVFWKIVYYVKNMILYRVGFMMSQQSLLTKKGIVKKKEQYGIISDDTFNHFEDADTYQVRVSDIESLTGLIFSKAYDAYSQEKSVKLILKDIDVPTTEQLVADTSTSNYKIENITL